MKKSLIAAALLLAFFGRPSFMTAMCPAEDVTDITLTDDVIIEDCSSFGIMLGGDNYYSGAALTKVRTTWNFEGTTYRQCPWGPAMAEHGLISWFRASDEWLKIFDPADVTVLSGPAAGAKAKFRGIEPIMYKDGSRQRELKLWKIASPTPAHQGISGLLVESFRLGDGQFRPLDGYWTSKANRIEHGGTAPGVFGTACLNMDGTTERAHLRLPRAISATWTPTARGAPGFGPGQSRAIQNSKWPAIPAGVRRKRFG